jgi:hypothetical protein
MPQTSNKMTITYPVTNLADMITASHINFSYSDHDGKGLTVRKPQVTTFLKEMLNHVNPMLTHSTAADDTTVNALINGRVTYGAYGYSDWDNMEADAQLPLFGSVLVYEPLNAYAYPTNVDTMTSTEYLADLTTNGEKIIVINDTSGFNKATIALTFAATEIKDADFGEAAKVILAAYAVFSDDDNDTGIKTWWVSRVPDPHTNVVDFADAGDGKYTLQPGNILAVPSMETFSLERLNATKIGLLDTQAKNTVETMHATIVTTLLDASFQQALGTTIQQDGLVSTLPADSPSYLTSQMNAAKAAGYLVVEDGLEKYIDVIIRNNTATAAGLEAALTAA